MQWQEYEDEKKQDKSEYSGFHIVLEHHYVNDLTMTNKMNRQKIKKLTSHIYKMI